ncbi:hypothetical protein DXG01_009713 [Tephrocybe rancida]|nr:hypothetical protein DXG01_009713 [Tephrocybe rancida]
MANPFAMVAENLRKIGAIPVAEYLASRQPVTAQDGQSTPETDIDKEVEPDMETKENGSSVEVAQDEHVVEIERACQERGCASPDWMSYRPLESENGVLWGAALRVHLAVPHFYATEQIHANEDKAKSACAQLAISEGILEAIKTIAPSSENLTRKSSSMSLREWFAQLPRPLPPFFDDKVLEDIHGAATLDLWATRARGARFKMHYYFPTCGQEPQRLFGCVLRIHRPKKCCSYLVEPVFSKRLDAKTAVCLLAISLGVEEYYLSAANEIANVITPELRTFVDEQILPLLKESHTFVYPMDRNAYACTLTVGVHTQEVDYTVEPEFASKADAKVAVLLIAVKNGLMEFMSHGRPSKEFQAQWETIETQVDHMPVAVTKPLKRKRDASPGPGPKATIAPKQESKRSKKRRKQANAAAQKQSDAATLFINQSISGPSSGSPSSNGLPSEKALGKLPANPMPIQYTAPFRSPMYAQEILSPPPIPGHVEHHAAWTPPVPQAWGIANSNIPPLPLPHQQPYPHLDPHEAHLYPPPPSPWQNFHGHNAGFVDPSFQGMRHEFGDNHSYIARR